MEPSWEPQGLPMVGTRSWKHESMGNFSHSNHNTQLIKLLEKAPKSKLFSKGSEWFGEVIISFNQNPVVRLVLCLRQDLTAVQARALWRSGAHEISPTVLTVSCFLNRSILQGGFYSSLVHLCLTRKLLYIHRTRKFQAWLRLDRCGSLTTLEPITVTSMIAFAQMACVCMQELGAGLDQPLWPHSWVGWERRKVPP